MYIKRRLIGIHSYSYDLFSYCDIPLNASNWIAQLLAQFLYMGGVNVIPMRKLNALPFSIFIRHDQSKETHIHVEQEKYPSDKINCV